MNSILRLVNTKLHTLGINPDLLKNIQAAEQELRGKPLPVEKNAIDEQWRKAGRPQVISNEELYVVMKNSETSLHLREALFKYEIRSRNKIKKPFTFFKTFRQRIIRINNTEIKHECLSMLKVNLPDILTDNIRIPCVQFNRFYQRPLS